MSKTENLKHKIACSPAYSKFGFILVLYKSLALLHRIKPLLENEISCDDNSSLSLKLLYSILYNSIANDFIFFYQIF